MQTARRSIALVALVALSLFGGQGQPTRAATAPYSNADFMRGLNYVSSSFSDFGTADSDRILSEFPRSIGANWVSIVVTCFQQTAESTGIFCLPYDNRDGMNPWYRTTPPDADVVHAINSAHSKGLKVMLKPHIDLLQDGRFRGDIGFGKDDRAWEEWFASYRGFIGKYALLARDTGTDALVVGTELVNTNRDNKCNSAADKRTKDWKGVVGSIRQVYGGKLYYAANYGTDDCGEDVSVDWWDTLDGIGVDAYYPLANETVVNVQQLVDSWQRWADRMAAVSQKYNKPVVLTEIGYQSRLGTHNMRTGNAVLNIQEQTDCYEATLQALSNKPWLGGIFWWALESSLDPIYAGGHERHELHGSRQTRRRGRPALLGHLTPAPLAFLQNVHVPRR